MAEGGEERAIGIDIGGSRARIALVEAQGVVEERFIATGSERPAESVADDVVVAVRALIDASGLDVLPIGAGIAGQIDPTNGRVIKAPNLGWTDFGLGEHLAAGLGRPVTVLNDVQAAAIGEWLYGAGRGTSDMIAVFVGTGVGGGIISGGQLVRGCGGNAGEIGHTVVDREGPLCACGSRGCVEAYSGGRALARRARRMAGARPDRAPRLLELAEGKPETITTAMIAQAAEAGDVLALRLIHDAADALGAGLASLLNTLNPCIVVLGGGVLMGAPRMASLVEASARARALAAPSEAVRFERAELEPFAGAIGAAAWARSGASGAEARATERI